MNTALLWVFVGLLVLILVSLRQLVAVIAAEGQATRAGLSEIYHSLRLVASDEELEECRSQLLEIEDHLSVLRRNEEQKRRESGSSEIEPDPDD
jgi:hypothetical protein